MNTTLTQTQKRLILVATVLASGMAFLDSSIVNIALPSLQKSFGATFIDMQWVINAYALTSAALLLLGGALGDRFGQRKVFSAGIGLFIAASLSAAFAHSLLLLIIARAVQGLGAAIMIPGSLAILNVSFPENERGRVIGLWAGVSGGMAAFGSFLGGVLIQHFGWQSVFYINVPLGIIALCACLVSVRDHAHEKRALDIVGTLLITFGLFGIAYGLMEAPIVGWGTWQTSGSLVIGVLLLISFIRQEMKSRTPMVPLEIFKNSNVVGANLATFFLYGALSAVFFLLALNLQQVQGLSPSATAIGLLPFPLLIMLFAGRGGQWADKIGPRMPMILGPLLVASGMALLAVPSVGVPVWYFLPGIVLWALGMCVIIAPLTKSALSVEMKLSGAASGVNNAVSRVAGLLAIAVIGIAMIGLFHKSLNVSLQPIALSSGEQQQISGHVDQLAGMELPSSLDADRALAVHEAVKLSFVYAWRWIILVNVIFALLSSFIAVKTIRNA